MKECTMVQQEMPASFYDEGAKAAGFPTSTLPTASKLERLDYEDRLIVLKIIAKAINEREVVALIDERFKSCPKTRTSKDGRVYEDEFSYSKIADWAVLEYRTRLKSSKRAA